MENLDHIVIQKSTDNTLRVLAYKKTKPQRNNLQIINYEDLTKTEKTKLDAFVSLITSKITE